MSDFCIFHFLFALLATDEVLVVLVLAYSFDFDYLETKDKIDPSWFEDSNKKKLEQLHSNSHCAGISTGFSDNQTVKSQKDAHYKINITTGTVIRFQSSCVSWGRYNHLVLHVLLWSTYHVANQIFYTKNIFNSF